MIIIAVIVIVASGSHRRMVAGGARAAVCVAAAITATVAVVVVVDAVEIETGLVCVFASARLPPARLGDAVVDAVAGMVRTVRCRVRGRIGR